MSKYYFTTKDVFGNYLTFEGGQNVSIFSYLVGCITMIGMGYLAILFINFFIGLFC